MGSSTTFNEFVCYTHKAAIVTRNVTDFEGCGISIINPWKPESI
jgi:toxin FitB